MSENVISRCHGFQCSSTSLIRAHIIPKGFARFLRQDGSNIRISAKAVGTARQQLGEYDDQILCESCDNKLGTFDKYAVEICRTFPQHHIRTGPDKFEFPNFEGDKFCKFVLAVLWRSSISKRTPFVPVQLGPYENVARDILFGARPLSDIPGFDVFAERYTSTKTDPMAWLFHAVKKPMFGRTGYGLVLGGFRILAKVSNAKVPAEFRPFVLNGKDTMRGWFIVLEETPEFAYVAQLAQQRRGKRLTLSNN